MFNKKVFDKNIELLNLDIKLLDYLKDNNINKISELWEMSKKDLMKMGLSYDDVREVSIKLQLCGLDLNKRIY